jgi:hypothetical protein
LPSVSIFSKLDRHIRKTLRDLAPALNSRSTATANTL